LDPLNPTRTLRAEALLGNQSFNEYMNTRVLGETPDGRNPEMPPNGIRNLRMPPNGIRNL